MYFSVKIGWMTVKYLGVVLVLAMLYASACTSDNKDVKIQTGDLLFQQWDSSDFAKAINAVTEGADGVDYAHIGLVLSLDDTLKVLEAVTGDGVVLRPLDAFLKASLTADSLPRVAIGRLKKDYSSFIPKINEWALSKVGMPYDTLFIYGNDKYYCSELIYDAFNENVAGEAVFSLAPMTFKDPETNNFFPVWETYYKKQKEEIPEGEPGINPGLISRSAKIEIVELLWE